MKTLHAIAIVDDDRLVRAAMSSLVRAFGYPVRDFASATDYLAADTREIACIISDVHMPDLSGIELQQRLSTRLGAPPVILMTAFPGDRLRTVAHACGAVALIDKPVDSNRLLALLTSVLD